MKHYMLKSISFVLSLMMIISVFSVDAVASNRDSDEMLNYGNSEVYHAANTQSRSVMGVIGGAVTVLKCVEYLGKTVRAVDAVIDAVANDDDFYEICGKAIDAFAGRDTVIIQPSDPNSNYSQTLYNEMISEIESVHKKIDGLQQDFNKIEDSINNLAQTIIAENHKKDINDFREDYIDLSKKMVKQYNELMVSLQGNDNNISKAKRSYDDLYITAEELNEKLFEYMTGSYREDGLSIQDVMFEYVNASDSLSQTEKNESCIRFAEDLFATYALSQYCLLICRLYQLDYCNYINASEYITENYASETIPYGSIVSYFQTMKDSHEKIVVETALYIGARGNNDMDILYIPSKKTEFYTLKYSQMNQKLYMGDNYFFHSNFLERYKYLFGEEELELIISNEAVARVENNSEICILSNGNFTFSLKYRNNVIASYNFTVRDRFLSGGYGIAEAPYLIGSVNDLSIASRYNPASHYKLISNINVDGSNVNFCFHSFSGVFDGNGYVISNVSIIDSGSQYIGFFGYLNSSAVIKNLTLRNISIKITAENGSYQEIGALAGKNWGTVYNCSVDSPQIRYKNAITASNAPYQKVIGGMIGNNSGVVENCECRSFSFYNTIRYFNNFVGKRYLIAIGGLVGDTNGTLKNNLVVEPQIIFDRLIFENSYVMNYPINQYLNLSGGFIIGTRNADPAEAVYAGGTLNYSAERRFYMINTGTSSGIDFRRCGGLSAYGISQEALAQFRLRSPTMIDRDVYKNVTIVNMPSSAKLEYGQPWYPVGLRLQLEYVNGMRSLVPITSVLNFNPHKVGKQTVELVCQNNQGKSFLVAVEVEVVCEHEWSSKLIAERPTHLKEGESRRMCVKCRTELIEKIPLIAEHNYGEWQKNDAMTHIQHCECGSSQTAEHMWDDGCVVIAPTHTLSGEKIFSCTVCGDAKKEAISPSEKHIWGEWVIEQAATCERSGIQKRKCMDEVCGYTESQVIPVLSHVPGDWIIITEATCSKTGQKCRKCVSGCGQILQAETIDNLSHELLKHEAKTSTCTEVGWNEYETCSHCGYTTYVEIPAKGHVYTNGICILCGTIQLTPAYVMGDLNGDGIITTTDVVTLRRYIAGGYGVTLNEAAADVNGDGLLSTTDVVWIRRYIAGGYGVVFVSPKA